MASPKAPSSDRIEPASVGDYAAFLDQIELRQIWLNSARVDNTHGPETPEQVAIQVDDEAWWEDREGGFRAFHCYKLRFQTTDLVLAEVEATFGLDFDSAEPMTGALFSLFRGFNLPVNSWPYLREFVGSTVSRMGWIVFTLPALKVGTTASPERAEKQPAAKPRSRGSRKTAGRTDSNLLDGATTT